MRTRSVFTFRIFVISMPMYKFWWYFDLRKMFANYPFVLWIMLIQLWNIWLCKVHHNWSFVVLSSVIFLYAIKLLPAWLSDWLSHCKFLCGVLDKDMKCLCITEILVAILDTATKNVSSALTHKFDNRNSTTMYPE